MLPLLLLPSLLAAPSAELHGYAEQRAWLALSGDPLSDEGAFSGQSRLQLDLSGEQGPASFRATGDLDLDASWLDPGALSQRGLEARFLPVECRLDLHLGPTDLSLGKQYVLWGQGAWASPTDLLTPWDYVDITDELEDYRIAPWAVRAVSWWGATSLDLVWVPVPQPWAMDFSAMESEMVQVGEPVLPPRSLENGDFGLRLASRLSGFDGALVAFHGLDKRPGFEMEVDLSTMPPGLTLVPTYHQMSALGGELSRAFGPVLWKAEAAWYRTEDADGTDPLVRNPEVYGLSGLTVAPGGGFSLSVEGTWSHLLLYDPEADEEALRELGDPSPEVDPEDSWAVVEELSWSWRDLLRLSAVAVQDLPDGDLFALAYAGWHAADGFTLTAGALVFAGPEDSRFGALSGRSRAFLEARYSF